VSSTGESSLAPDQGRDSTAEVGGRQTTSSAAMSTTAHCIIRDVGRRRSRIRPDGRRASGLRVRTATAPR